MNLFNGGSSTIALITILAYTLSLLYIASNSNNMMYCGVTTVEERKLLRMCDTKVRNAIQNMNNPVMYNFLILAIMQFIIDEERSMGQVRDFTKLTANNLAHTTIITNKKRIGIGINRILCSIENSEDRKRILSDILQVLDYLDRVMNDNNKFISTSKAVRHKVNATVIRAA